ncbi:MAG: 2,3-bisphosphoglycerate-dependent phosphoglycerate mutase [Chlamydiae bacterium]|nr:2,3-bisphosphoglycerate-dependent phosphoglycerate mutase [Chlamydiota bacterium]
MKKLILLRHGQSQWNLLNRFTGWVDVSLTDKGIKEAQSAGRKIKDIPIDIIFTSELVRAQMTAILAMEKHESNEPLLFIHSKGKGKQWGIDSCLKEAVEMCIPTHVSWRLNERFYGKLQGMNKDEARKKFGKDQVHIWRRSFDIPPPGGESLKMTLKRTLPYFKNEILPQLKKKNVLIAAHGNSLRAISMFLEDLSQEEVLKLEIPTGKPIIYGYDKGQFKKLK